MSNVTKLVTSAAKPKVEAAKREWNVLRPFACDILIDLLTNHGKSGDETRAELERLRGCIMFCDIKGFTTMMERFQKERGNAGVEDFASLLNSTFGRQIEMIQSCGGDVIQVVGDALICLFRASSEPNGLLLATLRALQCGLNLVGSLKRKQSIFSGYRMSTPDVTLHTKISMAAGDLVGLVAGMDKRQVSSFPGRKFFFLAGSPLNHIGDMDKFCKPDEVVVHGTTWAQLRLDEHCTGVPIDEAAVGYRLMSFNSPTGTRVLSPDILGLTPQRRSDQSSDNLIGHLRLFVPYAVRTKLLEFAEDFNNTRGFWAAGNYLAEFRSISSVFVKMVGVDFSGATEDRVLQENVQRIVHTAQKSVYRHEGSVQAVLHDEKGWLMFASWGMPPLSHINDPLRSALASLDIQASLNAIGIQSCVGISTDHCLCALMGTENRCQYTTYGDGVNLSSRLCGQAKFGEILADAATCDMIRSKLVVESLGAFNLKGKAQPVEIFRVVGKKRMNSRIFAPTLQGKHLIGHLAEKEKLSNTIELFVNAGKNATTQIVVIEGQSGFGKSGLLDFAVDVAANLNVNVHVGEAAEQERESPLFVWRQIVVQILKLQERAAADSDARNLVDYVLSFFDPEEEPFVPLLHDLLPEWIPAYKGDSALRVMSSEGRARKLQSLVLSLIRTASLSQRTMLVVKGGQWFGVASWELLRGLALDPLTRVLVVVSTRTLEVTQEFNALMNLENVIQLELRPLSESQTVTLTSHFFQGAEVSTEIAKFIYNKCQGNPLFTAELAQHLKDTGTVVVKDNKATLTKDLDELHATMPSTMYSAMTIRIDRLLAVQQLVLKVASVIGKVFSFEVLSSIFPAQNEAQALPDHLKALEHLRLIARTKTADGSDSRWTFCHNILHEVAYSLLVFSAKQDLHSRVGVWHEEHGSEDYSLLAYHFCRANLGYFYESALKYLEKAGDQALKNFSNSEALSFFRKALKLLEEREARTDPATSRHRARLLHKLGDVHFAFMSFQDCKDCYERALDLLGHSVPPSRSKLLASIARELYRQIRWRVANPRPAANYQYCNTPLVLKNRRASEPGTPGGAMLDVTPDLIDVINIHKSLFTLYYATEDSERFLYTLLFSLNLAERKIGPSVLSARWYAAMALMMQTLGLTGWARKYCQLAEEMPVLSIDSDSVGYVSSLLYRYYCSIGNWDRADQTFDTARKCLEEVGDFKYRELLDTGRVPQILICRRHINRVTTSLVLLEDVARSADTRGDRPIIQYCAIYQAAVLVEMLHMNKAGAILATELQYDEMKSGVRLAPMMLLVVKSMYHYRSGRFLPALHDVEQAASLLGRQYFMIWEVGYWLGMMSEVLIGCWDHILGLIRPAQNPGQPTAGPRASHEGCRPPPPPAPARASNQNEGAFQSYRTGSQAVGSTIGSPPSKVLTSAWGSARDVQGHDQSQGQSGAGQSGAGSDVGPLGPQHLPRVKEMAEHVRKTLKKVAAMHVVWRPRYTLVTCQIDWLNGRRGGTKAKLLRGLQMAQDLNTCVDEACFHYEIGRRYWPQEVEHVLQAQFLAALIGANCLQESASNVLRSAVEDPLTQIPLVAEDKVWERRSSAASRDVNVTVAVSRESTARDVTQAVTQLSQLAGTLVQKSMSFRSGNASKAKVVDPPVSKMSLPAFPEEQQVWAAPNVPTDTN